MHHQTLKNPKQKWLKRTKADQKTKGQKRKQDYRNKKLKGKNKKVKKEEGKGISKGKGPTPKISKNQKKGNTQEINKPSQMRTGFIVEFEPIDRQTEYKLSGATTWLNYLFYFQF